MRGAAQTAPERGHEMKYEVDYRDQNGATTAIDNITAPVGYTAEQYIEDCKQNADDEWNEMLQSGTVILVPHDYYIVTEGQEADGVYGDQYPVCLPEEEVRRLSNEFGTNLFEVMHEASDEEIEKYGVYGG